MQSREATAEEIEATGLVHRVFLPERRENAPVVFLVHGRAGNASVMWFFAKAFASGNPIIISPQAPLPDEGGWSWWEHRTGAPDVRPLAARFEDAKRVAGLLHSFMDKAIALYGGDKSRISGAGFSQGSGVLSTLSLLRPELFRGVAILSGFIPKAVMESGASLPGGASPATKYLVCHGTNDQIIPFSRAEETVVWLKARGLETGFHSDPVAHKVGTQGLRTLTAWYTGLSESH